MNDSQNIPLSLIEHIAGIIDAEKKQITNRDLLDLCSAAGVGGFSSDPHLCHEIAETALNFLILEKYGSPLLSSADPAVSCSAILKPLQKRLPTQSWRSDSQITYQQFSTPVSIAYLAAYLLNLSDKNTVLEPSCGTGSLVVWVLSAGATVVSNEIDLRRRRLAELIGFEPTGHDAEFIDDLLPEDLIPNAVLANPPFSTSGGRVVRNQSKFGFRHVETALRRLAPRGRFAIILGEGGSLKSVTGKRFWQSLLPNIQLTAAIDLPGREYYRNGVSVAVSLLIGRKVSNEERDTVAVVASPISITASSVEDAFDKALASQLRFDPTLNKFLILEL
ncbi:MAG: SAM-dependent DNA methyltransferase [Acidobacteria bacterium]|nr:SAM-dependent DNA methyltransferase [Acidobacteriota bacterium]